jgi:hypothetical protein
MAGEVNQTAMQSLWLVPHLFPPPFLPSFSFLLNRTKYFIYAKYQSGSLSLVSEPQLISSTSILSVVCHLRHHGGCGLAPFRPPHILRLQAVSFAALPGHDKGRIVENSELERLFFLKQSSGDLETDEAGSLRKPKRTVELTCNAIHKAQRGLRLKR